MSFLRRTEYTTVGTTDRRAASARCPRHGPTPPPLLFVQPVHHVQMEGQEEGREAIDAAADEGLTLQRSERAESKYTGVYRIPGCNKWRAEVRIESVQHHIPGQWATVEGAALARARYIRLYNSPLFAPQAADDAGAVEAELSNATAAPSDSAAARVAPTQYY